MYFFQYKKLSSLEVLQTTTKNKNYQSLYRISKLQSNSFKVLAYLTNYTQLMIIVPRLYKLTRNILNKAFAFPNAYFCQEKARRPDPKPQQQAEAQRIKQSYIQEYQDRLNNVQLSQNILVGFQKQIEETQNLKRQNQNPLKKLINWCLNQESKQQRTIEELKSSLINSKQISQQLWKQTVMQKTFTTVYQHKILGADIIQINKQLSKVDSSSFKNVRVKEGLDLTIRMINMILVKYGYNQFKPQPKQKFNKQLHEQVQRVRAPQPKDTIVKVVQEGWMLNQEVIIRASVIVSD